MRKLLQSTLSVFTLLLLVACSTPKSETLKVTEQAKIYVNQVAYEQRGAKSAVVAVPKNLSVHPTNFTLKKDVEQVFEGSLIKQSTFSEWQLEEQAFTYYWADFSDFNENGRYIIEVLQEETSIQSVEFYIDENALFNKTTSALLSYLNASRNDEAYNLEQDKHIRIFDTDRYVDVRGGWNDAGGDTGKYLSHLSYANFFNPQQHALVGWALAYSYQEIPDKYRALGLESQVIDEIFWGADYLHRILDPEGYFYMTVFDQWHTNNAERVVTAYEGPNGIYTEKYQSAFRQGAGSAIAALAIAYRTAITTGKSGEYSAEQYLKDAERAFKHLQEHNTQYCDDGIENIIDDYTALIAAVELYNSTKKEEYLLAARERATNLSNRIHPEGWFISNDIKSNNLRPFYHAAEAGFPVFSLTQYLKIEEDPSYIEKVKDTIKRSFDYQLKLNREVSNPFNYARQPFKVYKDGALDKEFHTGFFIPHANETGYWWQGESARLSSLSAAFNGATEFVNLESTQVKHFTANQLDWTLGRNPFQMSMLNGYGQNNPVPYAGLGMVYGGISNGITGSKLSDEGRGIEFGPEPDWQNWRWVEQWLPHSTWFLIATTEIAKR